MYMYVHVCAWHAYIHIILRIALSSMLEWLIAVYAARNSCYSYKIRNYPVIVGLEHKQYCCYKKKLTAWQSSSGNIVQSGHLEKLSMMDISGPLWNWLVSYLCNRVHRVSLASCSSSLLPVKSGVPQCSILGPLLFLVYVNAIFTAVSPSCLFLFADDTHYFRLIDCFSDFLSLKI